MGGRGPLLIMLHWLGGGAQTWREVSERLAGRGVRCAAVDLPGFGEAATRGGYSVAAMADAVAETVRGLRASVEAETPWVLAGHSMGGKVAAAVARRAIDGEAGLEGLRGLVLVSASPPGPEPMPEGKRAKSLELLGESTGDVKEDRARAGRFVDENTGKPALADAVRERAVDGVVGMNRTAFRMWMERGSKEDWGAPVGVLDVPALVIAGAEDRALGPAAQREHALPHLPRATTVTLVGAGHLGPIERAGEIAEHVTEFLAEVGLRLPVAQAGPGRAFAELLGSERVSPKTREVMEARLAEAVDWNHRTEFLTAAEFRGLRALVDRVVPGAGFDVAGAISGQLAERVGDGWRFAHLPEDGAAWRKGLRSLDVAAERAHGTGFAGLRPELQDELLRKAANGVLGHGVLGALHLGDAGEAFGAGEMQLWFEDVRGRCAQTYMADARTMERVGFTGFADDLGFTRIELGQQKDVEF